jgi:GNAT superfamily N-acetyltransferase
MELIKFFQTHPELKSEYNEIKREKGAIEAMNFALDAINAELEGEPYSVAEDQTEDENITVQNNVETSFRGGYGGTLIAKTPERQVGYLNYSIYNDKPQIGMIFVAQDYRRRGVAMKMLKALQELSPNEEIDWGITTDAGSNLRKSINYRKVPNPEIIKKKAKLAGVRSKLARLNYRLEQLKNTDVELARKFVKTVGDRWNQLNDLEYRLENELYLDKGEYSKLIPENK